MDADRLLSLAVAVAAERNLQGVLQTIVRGLAAHPGVALARIWLLLPGDICDSCFIRDECRDRTQCLHLVASAGTPIHSQEEDWSLLNVAGMPCAGVPAAPGVVTTKQAIACASHPDPQEDMP